MSRFLFRIVALAALAVPGPSLAAGASQVESQSNLDTLQDVVPAIITVLTGLLPFVATLYLVLSGYRYMVAQGNPELVEKAKKSLLYAVFGVIVAYASAAVIYTVAKALGYNPHF